MPLILHTLSDTVEIPDSYLLVGLDETGHEQPDGRSHPMFGLGGCAVPVQYYGTWLKNPWLDLKTNYFGGAQTKMHASGLSNPTAQQLGALGNYFRNGQFGRLAALTSIGADLPRDIPHFKVVARAIIERIGRFVGLYGCDGAVLVCEESTRTDRLAAAYFDGYTIQRTKSGVAQILPFLKYKMSKKAREPFLEVADFIIQAAGGQVRAALHGQAWGSRKDFQAIFREIPENLSQLIEIATVTATGADSFSQGVTG